MSQIPPEHKRVIDAVRDVAFGFFSYQNLTSTIIGPFNNFLESGLRDIVQTPTMFQGEKKLGLVEMSNVVYVPPMKGGLVMPSLTEKLGNLEKQKDEEIRNLVHSAKLRTPSSGRREISVKSVRDERDQKIQELETTFDTLEKQSDEEYRRKKMIIMRDYERQEEEILKQAYRRYPKDSWMLPEDCVATNDTYWLDVYADITITEYPKQRAVEDDEERMSMYLANTSPIARRLYIEKYGQVSGMHTKTFTMQKLFSIPLMVGCAWCWLTLSGAAPEEMSFFGECDIAPKGYFIVGGTKRVFVTQVKLAINTPRCEVMKDTSKKEEIIVSRVKCETINRNANYLSLIFGTPSGKSELQDTVKVLYMTLPFMRPDFPTGGKKKVKGWKNVSFNVLWIFRFYVIWWARENGITLKDGDSQKLALSEFNLYIRDVCFQQGEAAKGESLYYKVVRELTNTIIHFNTSDESPKDDNLFLIRLKDEYKLGIVKNEDSKETIKLENENITAIIERFKGHLDNQFFPQIPCPEYKLTQENDVWEPFLKFTALTQMMFSYVKCYVGAKGPDDRDSFETIQLATAGVEIGVLLRQALSDSGGVRRVLADELSKGEAGSILMSDNAVPNAIHNFQTRAHTAVSLEIKSCFSTGMWGLSRGGGEPRPGVVQLFETKTVMMQLHLLRKLAIPMKANSSIEKPRRVHHTSLCIADPTNTPDSDQVGLIRSLCVSVMISSDNHDAYDYIMSLVKIGMANDEGVYPYFKHEPGETRYPFYVNNILAGYCDREFFERLRQMKKIGSLGYLTEIYMKRELDKWHTYHEVHVKTVSGRAMRPVIVVKDGRLPILDHILDGPEGIQMRSNFAKLLELNCVEYISVGEFLSSNTAVSVETFLKNHMSKRYDYVELDPMMSMSVEIATQPFTAHNPNPRALYYGGMVRQAISVPMATVRRQQETETKILTHPHAPLIITDMAKIVRVPEQAHGQMVYVAVKSEPGGDEDPTRWREGFIRNGGLNGMILNTYETKSAVEVPDEKDDPTAYTGGIINVDYKGQVEPDEDEDEEIVRLRKYAGNRVIVKPSQLLVRFKTQQSDDAAVQSLKVTGNRAGFISHINIFTSPTGGRTIRVTVASPHIPGEGDKAAEEHAQKGVMGKVIADEDMPTNMETGLKPDVIFSPMGMPTRQTIGLPIVILAGLAFASLDKTRLVKTLLNWPIEVAIPEVNATNDFWIILQKGYARAGDDVNFVLHDELVEKHKKAVEEERIMHEINGTRFNFPAGVSDTDMLVESRVGVEVIDLIEAGYDERYGFTLNVNVASRSFISPDEDCISILKTDERAVLFSQLPLKLQREWYDQNESMVIPNYMLFVPRTPNDESITDASPFRRPDVEYMKQILEAKGYNRDGESKFIDKHGVVTKMSIFSGPIYYMQLAHLTDSKWQIRDSGPKSAITKGATQGKSKGGAVRAGELSQFVMYGHHGDGSYLAESFMTAADATTVLICREEGCGGTCTTQPVTNLTRCETCGSSKPPRKITVPFSGLRLFNMMGAGGAHVELMSEDTADDDVRMALRYQDYDSEAPKDRLIF
jgi:DNA-directed RNA polymerase beta subunit